MFETEPLGMPTLDFVKQAAEQERDMVMVAISHQPRIDDVFSLLKAGTRGLVIPPFTVDSFEAAIMRAAHGAPFSEAVLDAPDRNAALVGVVLNNFYRLTVRMRQARKFASARSEVDRYRMGFHESIELARIFCEGSDETALMQRIQEECASRAEQASSRLGRMRKRLAKQRMGSSPDQTSEQPDG